MNSSDKLLHALLDGDKLESGASRLKGSDAERFSLYRQRLELLEGHREEAPNDFLDRVMGALPERIRFGWEASLRSLWPEGRRWVLPALAGALTVLIVTLGMTLIPHTPAPRLVAVTFKIYAPTVEKIELIGTFSDWMREGITLKGPDAVGYWGCGLSLPPGRYEYLFLVDEDRLVKGQGEGSHRPDGFGYKNNVLLLREGVPHRFVQVHIPGSYSGVLIPKGLRARAAPPLPKEKADQWRAILNNGVSAGFQEILLEKALAGLATAGLTPDEASTILAPLFQEVEAGMHARHVLLKLREGILKGVSLEKLASAIHNRHQLFNKAKDLLTLTGHGEAMEEAPALLVSTALALESELHPLFLQEVLSAGKDKSLNQIKVVMEAGESLHNAGLAQNELHLVMRDCLIKDLESVEIERVVRHVRGKLREGFDSETLLDELWRKPGPAST